MFRTQKLNIIMNKSKTLLIDTCNNLINLGFISEDKKIFRQAPSDRKTFQILTTLIQEILIEANIDKPDLIICVKGPGSYTGLRLGVTHARTLAQLWKINVVGVSSLDFYSYEVFKKYFDFEKKCFNFEKEFLDYENFILAINAYQEEQFILSINKNYFDEFNLETSTDKIKILKINNLIKSVKLNEIIFTDKPELFAKEFEENLQTYSLIKVKQLQTPSLENLYELVFKNYNKILNKNWSYLLPYYGKANFKVKI